MTSGTTEARAEPTGWPDPDPDHVLTWRQQTVLQAIRGVGQRQGYAPTSREIGKAAGLASPSSVSYQFAGLQCTGYVRRDAKRPGTVEVRLPGQPTGRLEVKELANTLDIPAQDATYVAVPLLGQIPRVSPTSPGSSSKTTSCCLSSPLETGHCSYCGSRGTS